MTDAADEVEQWAAACGGSSAAFAAVYDRHRERVFRLALRLSENRHDAEDVTAAAFLELWRRRSDVRVVGGSVLPWLLVTASNAARNQARSIRRHRALIAAIPRGADDGTAAFEAVDDAEDRRALVHELRALPDRDRALLALTAIEGYSALAAAEALGISAGAARVRLHRLRGRLRAAYERMPAPAAPAATAPPAAPAVPAVPAAPTVPAAPVASARHLPEAEGRTT